jgi:hypothetical protein
MFFRRDNEHQDRVWVDRMKDGRADGFQPCDPCNDSINAADPRGELWHGVESDFCPECKADFLAHALAIDLFGLPRPFNIDLEGRVISNAEFEQEQRGPIPGAFDYFLPDVSDRQLPDAADQHLPEAINPPLPDEAYDRLLHTGDRPSPGYYDNFRPEPGDFFLPD